MADVRSAVAAAEAFIRGFPNVLQAASLRLEETDIDDRTGDWLITISFQDANTGSLIGSLSGRLYKQLKISSETNEVISMKDRPLVKA